MIPLYDAFFTFSYQQWPCLVFSVDGACARLFKSDKDGVVDWLLLSVVYKVSLFSHNFFWITVMLDSSASCPQSTAVFFAAENHVFGARSTAHLIDTYQQKGYWAMSIRLLSLQSPVIYVVLVLHFVKCFSVSPKMWYCIVSSCFNMVSIFWIHCWLYHASSS